MVKYFSSLSLTSPFILIIDRGQQFFALSLTRKRAVRTTLRNWNIFRFSKKIHSSINRLYLAFFFLTAAGDYSTLNAIRRDGEYIRLIAAKPLANEKMKVHSMSNMSKYLTRKRKERERNRERETRERKYSLCTFGDQ